MLSNCCSMLYHLLALAPYSLICTEGPSQLHYNVHSTCYFKLCGISYTFSILTSNDRNDYCTFIYLFDAEQETQALCISAALVSHFALLLSLIMTKEVYNKHLQKYEASLSSYKQDCPMNKNTLF